jgi:hypothetical protein
VSATGELGEFPPELRVIAGLTYSDQSQVLNRWLLPSYQTSFRWTGNRADAEDATTWAFRNAVGRVRLPEVVSIVDGLVTGATLDAASLHWSDRYGVDPLRCCEIFALEAALSGRPAMTLAGLVDSLSAEMRLVIVLRFLRRRALPSIAVQLGAPPGSVNVQLFRALSGVAEHMGLDACHGNVGQADQVAAFVDGLVGRRRPLRFEVTPPTWAAMLAATHIQAAVAGNNLPRARFVRSFEETFRTGGNGRHVTHLRIWSA